MREVKITMVYYVDCNSRSSHADGSKERPFHRIQQAADIAVAGDTVLVMPGEYREYVDPKNGGREDARITYKSVEPLGAVIKGSEEVNSWEKYEGTTWVARIPNGLFGGYNPYTTLLKGDWYYSETPLHTGEVYINGVSMYEDSTLEGVLDPKEYKASWEPEKSVYRWYTTQEDGCTVIYANFHEYDPAKECIEINVRRNCFYPSETGKGFITLSGFTVKQAATTWAPPTAYQEGMIGPHWSKGWIIEDCEVSDSICVGISLGKYLQPNNENAWLLKRLKHGTQTERDAILQAQREGWTKENIGSHIVRRCNIHHCEQAGIVGHLGAVFSLIEDNHIHHINTKACLKGAEIGGIKIHAAIDTTFRRNHIHHCMRGLWLDWQAQGTRVTQNFFHDNMPPVGTEITGPGQVGEDIFVEVSHGPTLIDNNIMLSTYSIRFSTQGVALVHNLIAGPFTCCGVGTTNGGLHITHVRYTPYHVPHGTEVAGFMSILHGDDRFYNNIFVQNEIPEKFVKFNATLEENGKIPATGTHPFNAYPTEEDYVSQFFIAGDYGSVENRNKYYDKLPVAVGGNVYFNGAQPMDREADAYVDTENAVTAEAVLVDGEYKLKTNLAEVLPASLKAGVISTSVLGEAFEPEQRFENPDGSEIIFDEDYFGRHRSVDPIPGPFAHAADYKM